MGREQLNKTLSPTLGVASFEFCDTEELFGFCVSRFNFQRSLEKLDSELEVRLCKKRMCFIFIRMSA